MFNTKQSQVHFEFVLPQLKEAETVEKIGQDGKPYRIPKVIGTEDLVGTVKVIQAAKSPINHEGIEVSVQCNAFVGNKKIPVFCETIKLADAGVLSGSFKGKFDFSEVKLPGECIEIPSKKFAIRYDLVGSVKTRKQPLQGTYEFCYIQAEEPKDPVPHKSEVGAENALQVEIEVPNTVLDIENDNLKMTVHFLTAQKKMDEMRVIIRRRDGYKLQPNDQPELTDWYDVYSYQVMDGAPVRNEIIPINLKLRLIKNLTPSFKTDLIKSEYQVLVNVVDTDGLSYYKDIAVQFYRGE